jgi:hypothetical protein
MVMEEATGTGAFCVLYSSWMPSLALSATTGGRVYNNTDGRYPKNLNGCNLF